MMTRMHLHLDAIQRETWNGGDRATVQTYDLGVRASVPQIGGRLEKLVGTLTAEGFDKEHAVGVAWLAGEHR